MLQGYAIPDTIGNTKTIFARIHTCKTRAMNLNTMGP